MEFSNICILCKKNLADTKEHFIPQIIGGRLGIKVLCKKCNSLYGSQLIKTYKTDPMIKIAMENFKDALPDLYNDFIKSVSFIGYDESQKEVKMKKRKNDLYVRTYKNNGIIITDTRNAPEILKSIITKDGSKDIQEPKALNSLIHSLPDDIIIPITESLSIKKTSIKRITPTLNTLSLEPRAILLAVYEFLYLCCFGEQILDVRFNFIRNSILNSEIDSRIEINSFYARRKYLPYHMLVCEEGGELKLKFIIFNSIYNIVSIKNIKLIKNKGYIFVDHLLEKNFYYNNNLEEAKKGINCIFQKGDIN
jgi:hypothetical protein